MKYPVPLSCLLLLVLMSLLLPTTVMAQRNIALVLGNAAYKEAPLRNPLNDARDMGQALGDLGFEVIEITNAPKKKMLEVVNDFGARLQQARVGLFYYAGHAVQYQGNNYLIPLQAAIVTPADLEQEAVDVRRILGRMEESNTALNIVILDACRNNPFRNRLGFRSFGERGLAPPPCARSMLMAYATAPDNVAADGTGRNGTYTKHLLRYLKQPRLSLPDFFSEVGRAVYEETNGTQELWVNFSTLPRFCFAGCEPPLASVSLQSPQKQTQQTSGPPVATRPGLGVQLAADYFISRLSLPGPIIMVVEKGSAAEAAGLRGGREDGKGGYILGDVIVGIEDDRIQSSADLFNVLAKYTVGKTVKVIVMRGETRHTAPVRLQDVTSTVTPPLAP